MRQVPPNFHKFFCEAPHSSVQEVPFCLEGFLIVHWPPFSSYLLLTYFQPGVSNSFRPGGHKKHIMTSGGLGRFTGSREWHCR